MAGLALLGLSLPAFSASVFATAPEDSQGVYLTAQAFGAHGDGAHDDSAALQAAIDRAENSERAGIVFVPAGRYRLTRTLYIWPGVRVIGYGATRPVFVLADNTPGFQTGIGVMAMFAVLDIPADPLRPPASHDSTPILPNVQVRKLEDGFTSNSGAAVDRAGKLYFVDRLEQRIYGWSAAEGLSVERDNPLDAVNLAFDKSGNLLVLSSDGAEGTVYWFRPGSPETELKVLSPQASTPHPGAAAILPGNYWDNGEFANQLDFDTMTYRTLGQLFAADVTAPKAQEYVSPDGSVFLPAARVFGQGPPDFNGWRFSEDLDAYGFVGAPVGHRVYVSNESEDRTYRAAVDGDGTLGQLEPFAERGGESVAVDPSGNVYVANGQIFVYNLAGKCLGQIDVPERPIDLVFGGTHHRTLFILSHHALFAARVPALFGALK